jgi:hypothetical protein
MLFRQRPARGGNLSGNRTTSDTMPDYLALGAFPEPRSVIHSQSVVDPEGGFPKRSGLAMARRSNCSMSPAPGGRARKATFLRGV